jgi:Protein of unknown function (DUF3800)
MKSPVECRYYFVDEAGDGTLFDARGRMLIGEQGVSRYFILGVLDVPDPDLLYTELEELRKNLLADSYFKKVPSMQPEARKTTLMFHAKDDVPEVRREVFALLQRHEFRFMAVVRNKERVLGYVMRRNAVDLSYRYSPNELYDFMVRVLFKNLLHQDERYEIYFSKRWGQDRTDALKQALQIARERFAQQWGKQPSSTVNVTPQKPQDIGGLQAVDYFLWSLQRFYERREDRYLELLWSSFRLVHDLDDTRKTPYGVYYTRKKPLTFAALDNDSPGI